METEAKITIAAVSGLAVGGGLGYLITRHFLKTKYEAYAEQEIAAMREHYQLKLVTETAEAKKPKPAPTEEELNAAYSDSIIAQRIDPEVREKLRNFTDYTKYSQADNADDKKETEVKFTKDPRPVPSFIPEDVGINTPYAISVEMYMANDEGYDQITLNYYSVDDVLTDDNDMRIDDVEETVGKANLAKFGEDSGDPYTVYVRNDQRGADYEITMNERSFARDIMGEDYQDHHIREPKSGQKKLR